MNQEKHFFKSRGEQAKKNESEKQTKKKESWRTKSMNNGADEQLRRTNQVLYSAMVLAQAIESGQMWEVQSATTFASFTAQSYAVAGRSPNLDMRTQRRCWLLK